MSSHSQTRCRWFFALFELSFHAAISSTDTRKNIAWRLTGIAGLDEASAAEGTTDSLQITQTRWTFANSSTNFLELIPSRWNNNNDCNRKIQPHQLSIHRVYSVNTVLSTLLISLGSNASNIQKLFISLDTLHMAVALTKPLHSTSTMTKSSR